MVKLFAGRRGKGWRSVVLGNARGLAKDFCMLDGTMSEVGIARDFIMIFREPGRERNLWLSRPMHVLLEVSVETLSRFYPTEDTREIYFKYSRFNGYDPNS
jgi:hypothetical protein